MAVDKDSLQPVKLAVYLTRAQWLAIMTRLRCHYDLCTEHANELDSVLASEFEKQLIENS